MANVEFGRNAIADRLVAPQVVIEVEAPGWTERVAVPSPVRPGEVRGAVEKVLRDLGLTTV